MTHSEKVRLLLLGQGPLGGRRIATNIGISQSSLSRALKNLKADIVVLGAGPSTRYALKRNISGIGERLPIFLIEPNAEARHLAELRFISPQHSYVESKDIAVQSVTVQGLPWWLDDARPSGFLGRLIPRAYPQLSFPEDIRLWNDNDCVRYWTNLGWDLVGNLVIGERALDVARREAMHGTNLIDEKERPDKYNEIALDLFKHGAAGSSAAGEQPKFLARKSPDGLPVLVKFSPIGDGPVSVRYRDLLISEYLALNTAAGVGRAVAKSRLLPGKERLFLEVERFDRCENGGRKGLVTLATLDNHFAGVAGTWRSIAASLVDTEVITKAMYEEILWRYYYGLLIANSDMHSGNISFFSEGENILDTAPIYDMLPMAYAPRFEQLIPFTYTPPFAPPQDLSIFDQALTAAKIFWQNVSKTPEVSKPFREIAEESMQLLDRN